MKKKIVIFTLMLAFISCIGASIYAFVSTMVIDKKQINTKSVSFAIGSEYYSDISSGNINITIRDNKNSDRYDLIIYSESDLEDVTVLGNTGALSGKCAIFEGLSSENLTVSNVPASSKAAVVKHDTHNAYVSSMFELFMLNQEQRHLIDGVNDMDISDDSFLYGIDYHLIYLTNDIDVISNITINVPGLYNLLWFDINLYNDLTISHHYSGINTFTTIDGEVKSNKDAMMHLYTYNGYFDVDSSIDSATYDIKNVESKVDLYTLAKDYIKSYIPLYLSNNIELPRSYHGYSDLTYSYDDFSGIINREEGTVPLTINVTIGDNDPFEIERYILGTESDALSMYLKYIIDSSFSANSNLNNSIDLKTILSHFYKEVKNGDFSYPITFGLGDDSLFSSFYITYKDEDGEAVELETKDDVTVDFISIDGDSIGSEAKVSINDGDYILTNFILRISKFVYKDNEETLYFNDSSSSLNVKSLDEEKLFELVSHNGIFDLYFLSLSDAKPLAYLNSNQIKYGENVLFDSTLNIKGINYKFFELKDSEYNSIDDLEAFYNDNTKKQYEEIVKGDNNLYSANSLIKKVDGYTIFFIGEVEFDSGNKYYVKKQVIVPEHGLGGDGDSSYIDGNLFGNYFSNHSFILDSEKDHVFVFDNPDIIVKAEYEKINGYSTLDNKTIGNLTISDDLRTVKYNNNTFLEAVDRQTGNLIGSSIVVTIKNAPIESTKVTVKFKFYYRAQVEDEDNLITEQSYDFVIPGVVRYGDDGDVKSLEVYMCLLDTYGSYDGYLLINNLEVNINTLDLSYSNINRLFNNTEGELTEEEKEKYLISDGKVICLDYLINCGIISEKPEISSNIYLDGIEYANLTKSIIIDGESNFEIESLQPLYGLNINNLAIRNVGLVNDKLTEKINSVNVLYSLQNLKSLDLSGNEITSINYENLIYRTVTSLNLSNNKLTRLTGIIDNAIRVRTLDISYNMIETFNELIYLNSLITVHLENNVSSNVNYGTNGRVNVPTYAILINRCNVYSTLDNKIIASDTETSILLENGYAISNDLYEAAIIINSLTVLDEYDAGTVTLPTVIYYQTSTSTVNNYAVTYVGSNSITATRGNTYKVLFSITYKTITIYRQIEFIVR